MEVRRDLTVMDRQSGLDQPSNPRTRLQMADVRLDRTNQERRFGGAPTPEDGVVILPEFKVLEKKVAQPDAEQWMTSGAVTAREVRRAEAEMSALELALNRWHIPLIMPSFAQRARANYESKKRAEEMDRLTRLQNLPGGN